MATRGIPLPGVDDELVAMCRSARAVAAFCNALNVRGEGEGRELEELLDDELPRLGGDELVEDGAFILPPE